MTPDEVEVHARSAKRQFERLGVAVNIDPAELKARADAASSATEAFLSAPATRRDIEELKELVLSIKAELSRQRPLDAGDVMYNYIVDAYSRSTYKVGGGQ